MATNMRKDELERQLTRHRRMVTALERALLAETTASGKGTPGMSAKWVQGCWHARVDEVDRPEGGTVVVTLHQAATSGERRFVHVDYAGLLEDWLRWIGGQRATMGLSKDDGVRAYCRLYDAVDNWARGKHREMLEAVQAGSGRAQG